LFLLLARASILVAWGGGRRRASPPAYETTTYSYSTGPLLYENHVFENYPRTTRYYVVKNSNLKDSNPRVP
jgi:hypothetical protein